MKVIKISGFIFVFLIDAYILLNVVPIIDIVLIFALLPACSWLVLLLHEVSHLAVFILIKAKIKELRVGLLSLDFYKGNVEIRVHEKGMYYGLCRAYDYNKIKKWKLIFALAAGGFSGLACSVFFGILLSLKLLNHQCSIGAWIMLFMGIYNFFITLLNPRSGDRKSIIKIREGLSNDSI